MTNTTYNPYQGGTGPEHDQVVQNNQFMLENLLGLGFDARLVPDNDQAEDCGLDVDELPMVVQVKVDGGAPFVLGYDRWGFCLWREGYAKMPAGYNDEIDQAQPDEVVKALRNLSSLCS